MELDPRIIEGKKPLTCFNTEMAKQFIGKECYFCDCPLAFEDLDKFTTLVKNVLFRVQDTEKPFVTDTIGCFRYAYCLPCEWVREQKESKWRPFSLNEFLKIFDIGNVIEFRNKNCDEFYRVMFIGYITNSNRSMDEKNGETIVMLGNYLYSLSHLFEYYELFLEDEWQPFGMEDKE